MESMASIHTRIAAICLCVASHNPKVYIIDKHHIWPVGWGGPNIKSNIVYLCPNAHRNLHMLLQEYVKLQSIPPWSTRSKYNKYVRDLATQAITMNGGIPSPEYYNRGIS